MGILDGFKKMILGYRASSESYIRHLKKIGVSVGEDVLIYRPAHTVIDSQNPHLLQIGNHVRMTGPVTILTHDYSWCVLKRKYGYIPGNQQKVIIGNNVFIGWGGTILCGSVIGDNVIIGANSVVTGNLEGDAVYAGIPARRIMSLDEYYEKRLGRQLQEATEYAALYESCYGTLPPIEKMDEYFYLFENRTESLTDRFKYKLGLMGNYEESAEVLCAHSPVFADYAEFLDYCKSSRQH